jgi:hypothetical protein
VKKVVIAAVVVGLALLVLAKYATVEAPVVLLFGWVMFLVRVLPRAELDRGSVLVGVVAMLLLVVGVQGFGRSWSTARSWKWRWSLSGVGLVAVLFAAGTALVGIVHQIGWLATSPEPLVVPTVDRYQTWDGSRWGMKSIGMGMHNYASASQDWLPAGGTFGPDGSMQHSWETQVLPYMFYSTREIDMNRPWNDPVNRKAFQSVIPEFIVPGMRSTPIKDPDGYGLSHYAANSRVMGANKRRINDIPDGTSTTLLIGEVNAGFQPWGHPVNFRDPARGINRSPYGFGGPRNTGGAMFVMADGSVRFISEKVTPTVLEALATPDGGEEVDASVLGPPR